MSQQAIIVEGLGKLYRLAHEGGRPDTFREAVMGVLTSPLKRFQRLGEHGGDMEEFWALRDVSFEVNRGQVVGIIGRNGAGKSTLLKILSRIVDPTEGRAALRGRVASLLEVGTGFHPELTGRENIYLNGSILGMRRTEITRKFDEIVAFAEIERFLDTPVKRYSSGMYVRLAFAVAAHLEPEILIVDEVLAVGDAEFQKRCLGKIKDVSQSAGRTVLFVSHNMNAVQQLCGRAILLERGRIKRMGDDVRQITTEYLFGSEGEARLAEWVNANGELHNPCFTPVRMSIVGGDGQPAVMPIPNDGDYRMRIEADIQQADPALTLGYAIYSESGELLYWSYQTDGPQDSWPRLGVGRVVLESRLPRRLLNEGTYRIELIASLHYRSWILQPGANAPHLFLTIQGGLSDSPYWMNRRPGLLAPNIAWAAVAPGEEGHVRFERPIAARISEHP